MNFVKQQRHLEGACGSSLVSKELFKVMRSHLNENMTGREKTLKKSSNRMIGTAGTVH